MRKYAVAADLQRGEIEIIEQKLRWYATDQAKSEIVHGDRVWLWGPDTLNTRTLVVLLGKRFPPDRRLKCQWCGQRIHTQRLECRYHAACTLSRVESYFSSLHAEQYAAFDRYNRAPQHSRQHCPAGRGHSFADCPHRAESIMI